MKGFLLNPSTNPSFMDFFRLDFIRTTYNGEQNKQNIKMSQFLKIFPWVVALRNILKLHYVDYFWDKGASNIPTLHTCPFCQWVSGYNTTESSHTRKLTTGFSSIAFWLLRLNTFAIVYLLVWIAFTHDRGRLRRTQMEEAKLKKLARSPTAVKMRFESQTLSSLSC